MIKKAINKKSLSDLLEAYGWHLSEIGKSRPAILAYQNSNRQLVQFLAEKGILRLKEVSTEHLLGFDFGDTHLIKTFCANTVLTECAQTGSNGAHHHTNEIIATANTTCR